MTSANASSGPDDSERRYQSAGQNVGVKEVSDKIWLVSFMQYDLGFFDHETCRLETVDNPSSRHYPCLRYKPLAKRDAVDVA